MLIAQSTLVYFSLLAAGEGATHHRLEGQLHCFFQAALPMPQLTAYGKTRLRVVGQPSSPVVQLFESTNRRCVLSILMSCTRLGFASDIRPGRPPLLFELPQTLPN